MNTQELRQKHYKTIVDRTFAYMDDEALGGEKIETIRRALSEDSTQVSIQFAIDLLEDLRNDLIRFDAGGLVQTRVSKKLSELTELKQQLKP